MENEGSTLLYKMLGDMLALANPVCLLLIALSSVCTKEKVKQSMAQHGTARHSTAGHGRARHRTAPHGAAPRR